MTTSYSKISAVILDLDGTLLNTEFVLRSVLKEYLATYGKVLITDNEFARVGKTQKESAAAIVKNYDLPLTPQQYLDEINPLYHSMWKDAKALPGANRLIQHLHKYQIPCALASNSLRAYIESKISTHKGWKECFSVIIGSDQVQSGKPAPDLFLEGAKQLTANTSDCLVIEDSLVGVKSGKAAGMKVVVVPSETEADAAALADLSLNSLLEFQPELWGLPPFDDWVDNALPVDPIYLDGQLVDGFVAEFREKDGQINVLPHQVCGIYFGWAKIGIHKDTKVVVQIKREVSSSSQSNIRLCSIDESTDHLNGEQMHLVLVGYIRGFNFKGSLSSNSDICEDDKSVALSALSLPMFKCPESS
ncbi:bifunctional riboflavin kinase/FMN phosphatase-like [Silene latifolia]|uniref:bifunctional riboflavin kinase/FMN phosphatase-like n=1 Tax=Silene latifolia TaxID=37657 RepID=UPI003D76E4C2